MKKFLGIELGSTRIKSVLIDENAKVLAQGSFEWKSSLCDGIWTYSMQDVFAGISQSYADLLNNYGQKITTLDGMGVSAMMHGYLAFDSNDNLLVPFRTWQNTFTKTASEELSREFIFNIPERWSVSHLYHAVINNEEHVDKIDFLTTLSGYVHYKLTGEKVLGVGDASGMFPVLDNEYDKTMLDKFDNLLSKHNFNKKFISILPKILVAGQNAGCLTVEGAMLLDKSGNLKSGTPLCPPEGDAGTGMVATNSVKELTGNVSAGTSAFVMAVMTKPLEKASRLIDVVTTPDGKPVAMVHVNNFTSEINAWAKLFLEVLELGKNKLSLSELFDELFKKSIDSDIDVGGLNGYNFMAGEPMVNVNDGKLMVTRTPNGNLNLSNFMQMQIYSALGALSLGMKTLKEQGIILKEIYGHGGFFKTEFIGANAMSVALDTPVTVMQTAGEGGAWGIAVLALYSFQKQGTLGEFLDGLFASAKKTTVMANEKEKEKFSNFMSKYQAELRYLQN